MSEGITFITISRNWRELSVRFNFVLIRKIILMVQILIQLDSIFLFIHFKVIVIEGGERARDREREYKREQERIFHYWFTLQMAKGLELHGTKIESQELCPGLTLECRHSDPKIVLRCFPRPLARSQTGMGQPGLESAPVWNAGAAEEDLAF